MGDVSSKCRRSQTKETDNDNNEQEQLTHKDTDFNINKTVQLKSDLKLSVRDNNSTIKTSPTRQIGNASPSALIMTSNNSFNTCTVDTGDSYSGFDRSCRQGNGSSRRSASNESTAANDQEFNNISRFGERRQSLKISKQNPSSVSPVHKNSTDGRNSRDLKENSPGQNPYRGSIKNRRASIRNLEQFRPGLTEGQLSAKRNSVSDINDAQSKSSVPVKEAAFRSHRRSSIAVLPAVPAVSGPSSLSTSSTPLKSSLAELQPSSIFSVSPMERVNISLNSATDLVSSLIGARRNSSDSSSNIKPEVPETSFWVPPSMWKKQRAYSLVPQKQDNIENKGVSGQAQNSSSLSNSLQEMYITESTAIISTVHGSTSGLQAIPNSDGASHLDHPGDSHRKRRASMQDAIDLSKFNASLYERPPLVSQKMFGSIQEENCGSLNLSLSFNKEDSRLSVRIIKAQDLVAPEGRATVNSYCRVSLLPQRGVNHLQSRVIKSSLCPDFDEDFTFTVDSEGLQKRTVEILLLDENNSRNEDDVLGQVLIPVEEFDLRNRVWLWKGISPYIKQKEVESWGDIMFSLTYLSSAERLTVVITKAQNLRSADDHKNSIINPFVRVTLTLGTKRIKKKRTTTKRGTRNPCWNEALVFNVQGADSLNGVKMELTVISDNTFGSSQVIGRFLIGGHSSHYDLHHWLNSPSFKTAPNIWHPLQPPTT